MNLAAKPETTKPDVPRSDLFKMIAEPTLTRFSAEAKKGAVLKSYKLLTAEQKEDFINQCAYLSVEKFKNHQKQDGAVYLILCSMATEREWEAMSSFLKSLLHQSSSAELYREIAMILLDLADNDLGDKNSKLPLGQTALVMLTEMGLLLANQTGQSNLEYKEVARIIEYITTNLLARSNMNNTAIRVALVHYLNHTNATGTSTLQLGRVISRFGQSLLDEILLTFFEDKKRGNAAFFFMVENLHAFFTSTSALAEMCLNVLKHHMLKFPGEFPSFFASFMDQCKRDPGHAKMISQLLAGLIRSSIEVTQRSLFDNLKKLFLKHLQTIQSEEGIDFQEHLQLCYQILQAGANGSPTSIRGRNLLLDEVLKDLQTLKTESLAAQQTKPPLMGKLKKPKDNSVKLAKFGEKPSPLESMLQLAC